MGTGAAVATENHRLYHSAQGLPGVESSSQWVLQEQGQSHESAAVCSSQTLNRPARVAEMGADVVGQAASFPSVPPGVSIASYNGSDRFFSRPVSQLPAVDCPEGLGLVGNTNNDNERIDASMIVQGDSLRLHAGVSLSSDAAGSNVSCSYGRLAQSQLADPVNYSGCVPVTSTAAPPDGGFLVQDYGRRENMPQSFGAAPFGCSHDGGNMMVCSMACDNFVLHNNMNNNAVLQQTMAGQRPHFMSGTGLAASARRGRGSTIMMPALSDAGDHFGMPNSGSHMAEMSSLAGSNELLRGLNSLSLNEGCVDGQASYTGYNCSLTNTMSSGLVTGTVGPTRCGRWDE
jgi:hypothetical protein